MELLNDHFILNSPYLKHKRKVYYIHGWVVRKTLNEMPISLQLLLPLLERSFHMTSKLGQTYS